MTALTTHIDRANLALLNDRLTQLRLRKECLEHELHAARHSKANPDVGALTNLGPCALAGLQDAMAGTRNDRTRDVIGAYVDRITVWPSQRRGELRLNPAAAPLWKQCYAELAEANCDTRSQPNRKPARTRRGNATTAPKDGRVVTNRGDRIRTCDLLTPSQAR